VVQLHQVASNENWPRLSEYLCVFGGLLACLGGLLGAARGLGFLLGHVALGLGLVLLSTAFSRRLSLSVTMPTMD
jgi:hypothetical protein